MMTVTSKMIEFPSGTQGTPGYLTQPDDEGQHPALVVIQEWWGLAPHIKDVAGRFAREGFIALAPDLYHGHVTQEPDEARKLAMGLDRNRAVAEITAAAQYLKAMEKVSPNKIGVVGWCMGGGLALSTAASSSDIGAAVAFYGRPLDVSDTAKLTAPVLGLYGELDQGIPVDAVHAFERELKAHNITHEIHIYPGAQHAFFNETRPHIYHAEAAKDAWQKTLAWFRKYLA
jgi:carboxymethylenebutenolidase